MPEGTKGIKEVQQSDSAMPQILPIKIDAALKLGPSSHFCWKDQAFAKCKYLCSALQNEAS